jgi:hypothetical protein
MFFVVALAVAGIVVDNQATEKQATDLTAYQKQGMEGIVGKSH